MKTVRPLADADRTELACLLSDEGFFRVDTHRPMFCTGDCNQGRACACAPRSSSPRIPRPRPIPTRPGLWARLIRLINWSKK